MDKAAPQPQVARLGQVVPLDQAKCIIYSFCINKRSINLLQEVEQGTTGGGEQGAMPSGPSTSGAEQPMPGLAMVIPQPLPTPASPSQLEGAATAGTSEDLPTVPDNAATARHAPLGAEEKEITMFLSSPKSQLTESLVLWEIPHIAAPESWLFST